MPGALGGHSGLPGIGVTDACGLPLGGGNHTWVLSRAVSLLNC